jgi:hypothetical protein
MRRPADRFILILLVALIASVGSTRAWADDPRAEARTHYQAGMKAYSGGDYKVAIKEFSAAQAIAPADLNNYNLALCYDKLGDAQPAVQYYKEYLNKVPNADKRAEIEASISRLEAAVKSADAKKADEQRKTDDARKADDAKKADEQRKADEAAKADAAKTGAGAGAVVGAGAAVGAGAGGVAVGVGSTGTPSTGQAYPTGSAQLDRVQSIDINAVRDQRGGGAPPPAAGATVGVGANANMQANAGAPPAAGGPPPPNGTAPAAAGTQPPPGTAPAPSDKPKSDPVYKKWWFWAVVAVSAYVVYEIATQSSTSTPTRTGRELPLNSSHAVPDIGPTLWHF